MASAFGFIVALASAMAWGGFDATRKRLVAGVDPISAAAWVSLAQGPLFLAWGAASGSLSLSTSYALVGSAVLVLQVVASVLLFRALAIAALSTVIPFLSLTPVFASLFGVAFLDERPSALQWVGIVTVVLAAVGMHARKTKPGRGTVGRGTVYAMGVALIWSFTSNLDKLALEHASLPVHAAVQSGGVGVVLLAWLLARGVLQPVPRKVMPVFATSVVMGTAALALQLWAIQLVFVGLVETIKRAAGLVSAAVLGRFMFGESITLRFVLGIVGVIVGTALLVLGGNI